MGVIFVETKIPGAFVVEPERQEDERGFFARTFSEDAFRERGLESNFVQCSISSNAKKGTLRGMHYQIAPHEEAKLVRCTMGSILDIILDLRVGSPTFRQWVGTRLSASNRLLHYVPKGCAHGFQSLEDDTEVFYQISEYYHPECARGVRWDDPAFGIQWPDAPSVISIKDRQYPGFVT